MDRRKPYAGRGPFHIHEQVSVYGYDRDSELLTEASEIRPTALTL